MTKTDNNNFPYDFEENNGVVYDAVQLLDTAQDLAENFADLVNQYDRDASDTNINAVAIEALHVRKQLLTLITVSQRMLTDCYKENDRLTSKYAGSKL
ncbi:hypothetical protein ACM640_11220 [Lactiplantibacillus plantarum]|uniref:hypothetical protein n=1 Tax=Lactiplantibacillus TaxID=2767842 RepID=UPI000437BB33|nr:MULTISPECIES: hypothetical protein [Lactiplantibacillus]EYR70488.1 hypothetical protein O209_14575 [Lactiplantibacillus plantarum WHE 92]AMO30194.1 hypothetical protein ABT40_09865 [Lactiplantibacillus plantarum]ARO07129.1 hypothetical protein BIZ33_10180 [Lactiplantibacillus plantarum]AZU38788.1 hypothetical protein B1H25_04140 [Lactiplantibacillus plantarum]MBO3685262.1 hypothetical protein [Lactiplantibacillus plantarum]